MLTPPSVGFLRPLAVAFSLATCPMAYGSDLTINGSVQVNVPTGGSVVAQLSGGPGLPAFVFYDASPGPFLFAGESVPLGLTPALTLLAAGTSSGAGQLSGFLFLPADPTYVGAEIFLCGALLDPADPNGVDISNGASFTIAPAVGAGSDFAGFVGERYTLDGSGALDFDQQLPAGLTAQWQLTSQPSGSTAGLEEAGSPFATIVPDFPGTYTARLTVAGPGVSSTDEVSFDIYELQNSNLSDGIFLPTNLLNFSATLVGPSASSANLEVGGQALSIAGGQVGPTFLTLPQFGEFARVFVDLELADGRQARQRATLGLGATQPVAGGAPLGASVHLRQGGLDTVAQLGEETLQAIDPASFLLSIPPTQVANQEGLFGFTIFSASVEFLDLDYDPQIQFDLAFAPTGLTGLVTLNNVVADFRVTGELLEVDYDLTGTITSSPVDMSGLLSVGISGGEVEAGLSEISVVRNNFTFDLDGFFGSVAELFIIESFVKDEVEAAVGQAVAAELPGAVEDILNSYELTLDLNELFLVDANLSAEFSSLQSTSSGMTLLLDGDSEVFSSEPGAPFIDRFLSSGSTTPVFGPTSPGGLGYGAATALGEEFLNLVLATTTGAGLLDGDLSQLLDPGLLGGNPGQREGFTAGALDVLFPGAGFDKFPEDTPIEIRSAGSMAPIVRATPGAANLGEITLSGLEVNFEITGTEASVPILRLAMDARAAIDLGIAPDGSLEASLSDEFVLLSPLAAFPGSDLQVLQIGIDFLTSLLLPQLTAALGQIPLPSLGTAGINLVPVEVTPIGPQLDHAGFFGNLAPAPQTP